MARFTTLSFEQSGLGSLHRATSETLKISDLDASTREKLIAKVRQQHKALGYETGDACQVAFLKGKTFSLTPSLGFRLWLESADGQRGYATMVYKMPCVKSAKRL
ncbi:MAG: hypothetical protein ABL949_05400 [Fimbriimonadaceae bacterium]